MSACNLKEVQIHKKAVFLLFSPTILLVLLILLLRHLFKLHQRGEKIVDIQKRATFSFSKSSNTKWITFDVRDFEPTTFN